MSAFAELYRRYFDRIYAYVYRRVGNAAEAEDLTSRVFFQALGALSRYTDRGAEVSTWLFRIAHNLVANWHRDLARRNRSLPRLGVPDPDDPVDDLIARELREKLRRAVAKLSAEKQRLLALKFSEGLSNAEIGAVLGKSEGAVKLLLHRTIKRLRQELLPEVEEP